MSHDNPNKPPKRPGDERKPSLQRGVGGGKGKAQRAEPAIQPKGLPQGARPAGVESYGSSNWRPPPPTQAPRAQQVEKPPSLTLTERFPFLLVWKEKFLVQWHKKFPPKEGNPENPGEEVQAEDKPDKFAKVREQQAAWGEKLGRAKTAAGAKMSAASTRVGAWWTQSWTKTKEKLGPPLAKASEKTGAFASVVATKCGVVFGKAFAFLGVWGGKGAALTSRTAKGIRDKVPPASELVRKLPGVSARLDALEAARVQQGRDAINAILAKTIAELKQRGVEIAARLQPTPSGTEFVAEKVASGEAETWLDDATMKKQIPPVLYHRRSDAVQLIAAKQRLPHEHAQMWQEGFLKPVITLAFVLHIKRVPPHLIEPMTIQWTSLIALQLTDPQSLEAYLWHTKRAWEVYSADDASRVAKTALAARNNGHLSPTTYDDIIVGLGQLT